MSQIGVSYTPSGGSPVYSFIFDNFGDRSLPRSYKPSTTFSDSANGSTILTGPAYRQKYMWAISSIILTTEASQFDVMFQSWDADRAAGLPAALGVTDETFGATISTSAIISTPPTYVRMGPKLTMISFALSEV